MGKILPYKRPSLSIDHCAFFSWKLTLWRPSLTTSSKFRTARTKFFSERSVLETWKSWELKNWSNHKHNLFLLNLLVGSPDVFVLLLFLVVFAVGRSVRVGMSARLNCRPEIEMSLKMCPRISKCAEIRAFWELFLVNLIF